jgi:mRNA degradation ribonuclease J1/J2
MVKDQTTLAFYGGVNEIGGNKILLQDRGTKVFFDFGMSFTAKKQFYSPPFLSPKNERSLQELGMLPKIDDVYKFDQTPADVDAMFLSTGTWITRLTCRSLNVKSPFTAAKQHKPF